MSDPTPSLSNLPEATTSLTAIDPALTSTLHAPDDFDAASSIDTTMSRVRLHAKDSVPHAHFADAFLVYYTEAYVLVYCLLRGFFFKDDTAIKDVCRLMLRTALNIIQTPKYLSSLYEGSEDDEATFALMVVTDAHVKELQALLGHWMKIVAQHDSVKKIGRELSHNPGLQALVDNLGFLHQPTSAGPMHHDGDYVVKVAIQMFSAHQGVLWHAVSQRRLLDPASTNGSNILTPHALVFVRAVLDWQICSQNKSIGRRRSQTFNSKSYYGLDLQDRYLADITTWNALPNSVLGEAMGRLARSIETEMSEGSGVWTKIAAGKARKSEMAGRFH